MKAILLLVVIQGVAGYVLPEQSKLQPRGSPSPSRDGPPAPRQKTASTSPSPPRGQQPPSIGVRTRRQGQSTDVTVRRGTTPPVSSGGVRKVTGRRSGSPGTTIGRIDASPRSNLQAGQQNPAGNPPNMLLGMLTGAAQASNPAGPFSPQTRPGLPPLHSQSVAGAMNLYGQPHAVAPFFGTAIPHGNPRPASSIHSTHAQIQGSGLLGEFAGGQQIQALPQAFAVGQQVQALPQAFQVQRPSPAAAPRGNQRPSASEQSTHAQIQGGGRGAAPQNNPPQRHPTAQAQINGQGDRPISDTERQTGHLRASARILSTNEATAAVSDTYPFDRRVQTQLPGLQTQGFRGQTLNHGGHNVNAVGIGHHVASGPAQVDITSNGVIGGTVHPKAGGLGGCLHFSCSDGREEPVPAPAGQTTARMWTNDDPAHEMKLSLIHADGGEIRASGISRTGT